MKAHLPLQTQVLVCLGLLVGGCRGSLIIATDGNGGGGGSCTDTAQCDDGETCVLGECIVQPPVCSLHALTGRCPAERECSNGVCVPEGETWCECTEEQGCVGGECFDISDPDHVCSDLHLDGVCPNDEVCTAGHCVPCQVGFACASDRLDGCCAAGASCDGGFCVPIEDRPCSPTEPNGLCPAGQACLAPGECQPVPCSLDDPDGACPADEFCNAGTCEPLPCSPGHVEGTCPEGEFCSGAGECLTEGECAVAQDCTTFGDFCSVTGVCLPPGECGADEDCQLHDACVLGECTRDYTCAGDPDCFPSEHCVTGGTCMPDGQCAADADCALAESCSSTGMCIPEGTCLVDDDCDAAQYCNTQRLCIPDGGCGITADCPPGHACDTGACVLSGTTCTLNDPPDCEEGQRCSAAGSCIEDGQCVDATDCAPGLACIDYLCSGLPTCSSSDECEPGFYCSFAGGCLPDATCGDDGDCDLGSGEVCTALFECAIGEACGSTEFQASLVPPNMLIVLDRSGSMSGCDTDSVTRWLEAVDAIDQVTLDHQDKIRFGLASYPLMCPGTTDVCSSTCDAQCQSNCGGSNNCQPGSVDVTVGENTRTNIVNSLSSNFPGGYTPTGPTLRAVAANPTAFGLPDPADPIVRDNYVLLVTDGEPNCDTTDAVIRVNGAIESLRNLNPSVTTFVVGFSFDPVSATLNCNAVFGGTSRCDTAVTEGTCSGQPSCPALVLPNLGASCSANSDCASNECENGECSKCNSNSDCGTGGDCSRPAACAHDYCTTGGTPAQQGCDVPSCSLRTCTCNGSSTTACYYEADNAQSLSDQFDLIVGQVASCTYALDDAPPDADLLFVYLDDGTLPLVSIPRDPTHQDRWDVDATLTRITFYGPACDLVKSGAVTPRIIYGCDIGG